MDRRLVFLFCVWLTHCGQNANLQNAQTDAAILLVSPGPIFSFPGQLPGNTTSQIFTVTNTGKRPASQMVSSFYLSSTFTYVGGYPGADGTCADQLAPGESCQVRVTFSPSYSGNFQQTFPMSYHDGYLSQLLDFPQLRGNGL